MTTVQRFRSTWFCSFSRLDETIIDSHFRPTAAVSGSAPDSVLSSTHPSWPFCLFTLLSQTNAQTLQLHNEQPFSYVQQEERSQLPRPVAHCPSEVAVTPSNVHADVTLPALPGLFTRYQVDEVQLTNEHEGGAVVALLNEKILLQF